MSTKEIKITPAVKKYVRQVASLGGKARAAKYDPQTLSKWAGRGKPRKPWNELSQQGKWARARRARKRRERDPHIT
jgi:hypothetical protein